MKNDAVYLQNQRSTADSGNSTVSPTEFADSGFANSEPKMITTSSDCPHEDLVEEHFIAAVTSQPFSLSDSTDVAPATSIVPVRSAFPPPHAASDTVGEEGRFGAQETLLDLQQQQPVAVELPIRPEDYYSGGAVEGYDVYGQPIATSSGGYGGGTYYGQGGYDAYGTVQPSSDGGYGNYGGEAGHNYYDSSAYGYDANAVAYGASAATAASHDTTYGASVAPTTVSYDTTNSYAFGGHDYGAVINDNYNNYATYSDTTAYGTDNSTDVPVNGADNDPTTADGVSSLYYDSGNCPTITYDTTGGNEGSSGYVYSDGTDDYSKYGSLAQQPTALEPPLLADDYTQQQYVVDGVSSVGAFDGSSDVGLTGA